MTHNKRYIALLKKSLSWLRENPDPAQNDVPEELAVTWLSDSGPNGIGFVVFLAGYFRWIALLDEAVHVKHGKELEMIYDYSPAELQSFYLKWRIRLALSVISRHTPLFSVPRSLFMFDVKEVEGVAARDVLFRAGRAGRTTQPPSA